MNKKAQSRLPSSFGGLVQYYSEYKSKINIDPKLVIVLGLILVTAVVIAKISFG